MNVTCPECQSVFRVDPAKVPATGIRARCSVCGGIIVIAAGTLAASVTPNGRATSSGDRPAVTPHESLASGERSAPFVPPPSYREPQREAPRVAPRDTPRPPTPAVASGTPSSRKSINPFLNADPGQRARRLARALVSDLVAYHPQKREEGLRNGTLRQLFRDEIKKSYEEFAEQVGRDTAESSTHFQEALNEVLAGGRKLF